MRQIAERTERRLAALQSLQVGEIFEAIIVDKHPQKDAALDYRGRRGDDEDFLSNAAHVVIRN